MAIMCEECKCSIYLEEQPDGSMEYGGCESGCDCCNDPNWSPFDRFTTEEIEDELARRKAAG